MFDAVEQRVNASVFKTLVNALATPSAGSPFGVVFDPAGALVDSFGVVTQQPQYEAPVAGVLAHTVGMAITIRGTAYTVRQVLPLDEGLRQRVILARA